MYSLSNIYIIVNRFNYYLSDKMAIDLTDIGIEEGQKYEGIYTTMSKDGVKNAAPIGIACKGKDKLECRLFVGTQTLKNIMDTGKYVLNFRQLLRSWGFSIF